MGLITLDGKPMDAEAQALFFECIGIINMLARLTDCHPMIASTLRLMVNSNFGAETTEETPC